MSERLIKAIDEVKHLPEITLGSIVDRIGDDALLIVCLIAILPFMQPIPIPGLSTLLGFVVLLQGLGMIFLGKPLLTKRMKEMKLSNEKMLMIYKAAVKFDKFTSKISTFKHPGLKSRGMHILSGITITLAALFLSLPLPIPFSNFIPALCIFFICAGLLEQDVALVAIGHAMFASVIWMAGLSFHLIAEKLFW
ncbi:MAG: exopolysaccharide biosynthesis protein [Bdellovibrionota bacterium]